MWAALLVTVGLTVVAKDRLDAGGGAGEQVVSAPSGSPGSSTTSTTTEPAVRPGPGQVRVQGTVSGVHLEGAVLDPRRVPTPLTITSDRGMGNGGALTGVLVDGKPSSIVWDGGRPFALSGGGALVVGPAVVDLVPQGVRLTLRGSAAELEPGLYRLDTPVAVGRSGIATPRDNVSFEATSTALFEARGDAGIVLGPGTPHRLLGPGSVLINGVLDLTDASGTRSGTTISLAKGAFDLTLTASGAGGWRVDGLLDSSAAS